MKLTTKVFARFESKGLPESTVDFEGTVREFMVAVAKWTLETQMGSHMQIIMCRNADDLNKRTGRVGIKTKHESALDAALNDLAALGFNSTSDSQENA